MNDKINYRITITKEVKNKLNKLGVYDKWFYYTRKRFEQNKQLKKFNVCNMLQKEIQKRIKSNDVLGLISIMINDLNKTDEGFDYWIGKMRDSIF